MSSAAIATAAAASQRSCASMKRSSSSRSSAVGAPADQRERRSGRCSPIVARARCRALFAAGTLVSSRPAVSSALQPSTSRAISAARCRAGSSWRAARNTSSIVSRSTAAVLGPVAGGRDLVEQRVRIGLEPRDLRRAGPERPRRRRRRASMHTLVAIRYSQARADGPPRRPSRPRHARRNVSCTASSASSNEASIR